MLSSCSYIFPQQRPQSANADDRKQESTANDDRLWLVLLKYRPALALFDPRTRTILHRFEDDEKLVRALAAAPLHMSHCSASPDCHNLAFAAFQWTSDSVWQASDLLYRVDIPNLVLLLSSASADSKEQQQHQRPQQLRAVTLHRRLPPFLGYVHGDTLRTWFSADGHTLYFRHTAHVEAKALNEKFQRGVLGQEDSVSVAAWPIGANPSESSVPPAKEGFDKEIFREPLPSESPKAEEIAPVEQASEVGSRGTFEVSMPLSALSALANALLSNDS